MKVRLSRENSRALDARAMAEYGLPGLVLMENAGRGVVDKICQFGIDGPIVVCCGKGNNGGDGLVIARHLDLRRISVEVLLFADPAELSGDALVNYQVAVAAQIPMVICPASSDPAPPWRHLMGEKLRRAGWIVDALLGTGFQGNLRAPYDKAIEYLNRAARPVVAVDLPSGLDCDTGHPAIPTVRATHTCTFVAEKLGFAADAAHAYLGVVHVLDIGAPRILVEDVLRTAEREQRK
ncbi:MAG: NAD(P)H-hydrate epimerase [Pirellulales bacterium]|nr:NAD(P)H-hydrate epimerase [Pirellulales bacterium]